MSRTQKICLFLATILIAAAFWWTTRETRYNVVLVVADALRADTLSCYGGPIEAKNICSLAKDGVLFEYAFSNSNWTLPSSVSLLTGEHAAAHYMGTRFSKQQDNHFFYVNPKITTLAEGLKQKGYLLLQNIENPLATRANTLQGFSSTTQQRKISLRKWTKRFARQDKRYWPFGRFLDALEGVKESNFMAIQWFFDPHDPYDPPAQFLSDLDMANFDVPHSLEFYRKLKAKRLTDYQRTPEENRLLYELYLREIKSVDQRMGHLLSILNRDKFKNTTYLVFTADHGESFGEHQVYLHGRALYNHEVRVPLIITGPGLVEGQRVNTSVSLIDIMATLRELLDIDCLEETVGESLVKFLTRENTSSQHTPPYLDQARGLDRRSFDALVKDRNKIIIEGKSPPRLFKFDEDKEELIDRAAKSPPLTASMVDTLLDIRKRNKAARESNRKAMQNFDFKDEAKRTLKTLKGLGYVD